MFQWMKFGLVVSPGLCVLGCMSTSGHQDRSAGPIKEAKETEGDLPLYIWNRVGCIMSIGHDIIIILIYIYKNETSNEWNLMNSNDAHKNSSYRGWSESWSVALRHL